MKYGDSTDTMLARERLLARCAAQRDDLAALSQELEGPLKLADRAVAGVRYVREHPLLLGAAVAALAVVQQRGLWKWARRGFVAWRAYRAFGKTDFKSVI